MNSFDYIRPATVAEAIAAAAEPGSAYLAAGTNLIDMMKTGALRPDRLVDLTHLPGLSDVEWLADGGVRIGALVRNADLAHDPDFAARFPTVAEALLAGASAQLRNAATVGGNLMQRTRCRHFADPASACNRRVPGSGCDAIGGETRTCAILGHSQACVATHPSDFCVPLVALDAVVEIVGREGAREVPLEDFHLLPGDRPMQETMLEPGDLITGLRLPAEAVRFSAHSRYLKLRDRTSYAFALVSVAACLTIEAGEITEARIALGGVAAKPWRAKAAERVLIGAAPGPEPFWRAAEAALEDARPVSGPDGGSGGDNAFKIALAGRIVTRALKAAAAGTPARVPALPGSVHVANGDPAHA